MSNTIHDMGGMHGFGKVEPEPNEPVFTRRGSRVHAMQRVLGATGLWTIDAGRASLEALPPRTYLATTYYQRWFLGLGASGGRVRTGRAGRTGGRPFFARSEAPAAHGDAS